jgi:hypothetical protein
MTTVSAETIQQVWTITLVVYAVVLVVVAVLLALILRAARDIRATVADIWTVGQRVANNTIHIALLDRTNHVAGAILGSARAIVPATAALRDHAAECRGCPGCVLGGGASR